MIGITARYFAVFRDQAGQDVEALHTRAETAGELYAEIAAAHGFADPMARCKVAVNDELADWNTRLADGDTVLFFPPVAGG
jgi:molybdopterin converting factor subunit 1